MAKKKQREAPDEVFRLPLPIALPVLGLLLLVLGGLGTFAGVRAKRREEEANSPVRALLATVPAGLLAIGGLLGVAALRRRRHEREDRLNELDDDAVTALGTPGTGMVG